MTHRDLRQWYSCRSARYHPQPQSSPGSQPAKTSPLGLPYSADPEIAIDRKQLRAVLNSLESFSGE